MASRTLVTTLGLGSVLSGGGSVPTPNTPEAWADMVDGFQQEALSTRLGIPIIYGVDAVHGHGNVLGATIFPHNIGLGATRDARLGRAGGGGHGRGGPGDRHSVGLRAVHLRHPGRTLGPQLRKLRRGPATGAAQLGAAAVVGLQGRNQRDLDQNDHVLATVKHFAGDGDTTYGTPVGDYKVDQGITITNRRDFDRIDLAPYKSAIRSADAGSAMPSFSSVDWTEDGVGNPIKMHQNRELITDVLKGKMGLDGFVISDWEGIHQLPGGGIPEPIPRPPRFGSA